MDRRWSTAVCLLVATAGIAVAEPTDRSALIALGSYTIDLEAPAPEIPAALAAFSADTGAEDVWIFKFPGPITAVQREALETRTQRVYSYLPYDAFLVRLAPGADAETLAREIGASWTGLYHPAYKISTQLARLEVAEKRSQDRRMLLVQLFPEADLERAVEEIERLAPGIIVGRKHGERFSRVRILAPPAQLAAVRDRLALLPEVFWLDLEGRRVLLNDTTVWVAQSGTAAGQTTPVYNRGIFGNGQVIAILDTGVDPDMCYFRDGTLGLPPTNACNGGTVVNTSQRKVIAVNFLWSNECAGGIGSNEWDTHDHGSHVAGTAAGDNLANPITHDPGDGIAPGAKLVVQDCGFQTNNCADCPGIGCPVVDLNPIFQQTYTQGARIHSNSWGDDENNPTGGYSAGSQDVDEFMWNHKDFLLVFAAGNSGPGTQTVYSPSTGKNVLGVGATLRGTSAESMASFSSCGPTADGRIKPDVTLPGSSITSANADNNTGSNNCNTGTLSGTSMAAPAVAGTAALVRQYFMDGFYPTGAAVAGNAFTPSAALTKAALINSAHDMNNVTDIPSNCQGWGRVLLDNALFFTGDSRDLSVTDNSTGFPQGSSGATQTYNFTVATGEPFKVTLVWTDFPSTPAASVHLINDLDLEVTGPSGTYKGNVFSAGQSALGGTADRRNTVEQVLLKTPAAGAYTVTVRSFTVPNGPQPFAVVVTGNLSPAAPPVTVFSDTFETSLGWTLNPNGTDNATAGVWERGDPEATTSSGAKQLGTTVSGTNDLVTGRLAGSSAGVHDLDGGLSTMRSPAIVLPAGGTSTLSFSYYMAHANNSSTADYLRVKVVGTTTTTVLEELGAANDDDAVWALRTVDVSAFGGQTVRIQVEANDSATASLVEAAIDDVLIVHQP